MSTVAILGCGNIGLSIAEGLLKNSKKNQSQLILTRRNPQGLKSLAKSGVEITTDNVAATKNSKYIIIAVKPFAVMDLLKEIQPALKKDQILISVASEISIDQIKSVVKKDIAVFRVMPNTAAAISESITCISTRNANSKQIKDVENIFSNLGQTVIIDEKLMEAATILGACGIAYVLRFIRAMIQGGIQIGFDAATASKITTQTVKGAAELLLQLQSHPEQEIDKVTTPKGCTITGLNEMEHQGFSSSLIKGIVKSYEKIEKK